MKKTIIFAIMFLMAMSVVSANWVIPDPADPIKTIEEPEFRDMPNKVYINDLTGNFVDTHYAIGGWYYDNGWDLQDFMHTTAKIEAAACTTGQETFLENYAESGTEASGDAWKFDAMSLLNADSGTHDVNNKITAWTVNAVPPGAGHTSIFYEEFTGNLDTGIMTSGLVVEGYATGISSMPTVIQTHYETSENIFQQRGVKIN